jgi:hypothetical protein
MSQDAVTLITQDHRELEAMFERLTSERGSRPLLTALVGAMLVAHSRAEEEKVYPEIAKASPGEEGEVHHGAEEHHEAEAIFHRLEKLDPEGPEYDSVLQEFVEAVKHHVQEEESEILPALQQAVSSEKLQELGQAFAAIRAREITKFTRSDGGGNGRGPSGGGQDTTKDELYDKAREAGIEGRSTMSKDELAKAVQQQG